MNIEDEIINAADEEMAQSMDFDILCDLLVPMGYTVINIKYGPDSRWVDVIEWADRNCSGNIKEHKGKWLFKNPKDATMFMLRWA